MDTSETDRDAPVFDRALDVVGMTCPHPILKTKKALFEMASGQVLRVLATDPGTLRDFEAFSRQTGHRLLSSLAREGGLFEFYLQRK